MSFFTGILTVADIFGIDDFIRNKLKRSDADWKEFLSFIYKLVKAVCKDYRESIALSPDHKNIHFPDEYEKLLYESVCTALESNTQFTSEMILPLEKEFPEGEKRRLYELLKARLQYNFEYVMRDGQIEIKDLLKGLMAHVDDTLPQMSESLEKILRLSEDVVIPMLKEIKDTKMESHPSKPPMSKTGLPPHNLPQPNLHFSGRVNILDNINKRFHEGTVICLQQTIAGLGGVGKTETALKYAHKYGSNYTDAIGWLNAETETSLFYSCRDFFGRIGRNLAHNIDTEQLGAELQYWQRSNTSWLLIFDNVEQEEFVKPYLSTRHQGHILFTSRKRDLRGLGPCAKVDVEVFTHEEALAFMRERLADTPGLTNKDIELAALIERLGCFPLVLEQATAYMERTGMNCGQYLKKLEEKGLVKFDDYLAAPTTNYERTISGTFAISYEALGESARQLLNLCAYMAPDKIPVEFFTKQAEDFPPPLCNDLTRDEDRVIAELFNYSLVKRSGNLLDIHRFVQEICREHIKNSGEDWLGCCLEAMVDTLPRMSEYSQREIFEWFELLSAHAEAIAEYSEVTFADDEDMQETLLILYHLIGTGNEWLARYSQALQWRQREADAFEKVLGKEHPGTAITYNNIAMVFSAQGDYDKALEWHNKALDIREKVLDIEHPDTAMTYNNIALVFNTQGDYDKALELHYKALGIREKVLGIEHPNTAMTYNNIAMVFNAQGDYDKALDWHYKALNISKKVEGKEHPNTATSYNNIASIYYAQGDYDKALDWYYLALDIREKVLGKEHPDTAITYNNIAFTLENQRKYEEALKLFQKKLSIMEKTFGTNHPKAIEARSNVESVSAKIKAGSE
ncbi:MAG: FxSxx-COOH system tetratricopeptide repeat protein [Firmicutes bacterium]|nr:FxSxx-COOH system tetratricopeptide repeat protein [Bacillota bacterium]